MKMMLRVLCVMVLLFQTISGETVLVKMCQFSDCSGECLTPRAYDSQTCFSLHGTVSTETVSCIKNTSTSSVLMKIFPAADKTCAGQATSSTEVVCGTCLATPMTGNLQLVCSTVSSEWFIGVNCSTSNQEGSCTCSAGSRSAIAPSTCTFVNGVGNVLLSAATLCPETVLVSQYKRIYCQGAGDYSVVPNGGCVLGTTYTCSSD